MSATEQCISIVLERVTCVNCGIVFGLDKHFVGELRESHKEFCCPNGHSLAYNVPSEKERRIAELERQAKALTTSRDYWQNREAEQRRTGERLANQVNGYKGVVTRMKRRTVAGRCPCCSHQFKDLKRHMANQHPDWNPDRAADAMGEKGSTSS